MLRLLLAVLQILSIYRAACGSSDNSPQSISNSVYKEPIRVVNDVLAQQSHMTSLSDYEEELLASLKEFTYDSRKIGETLQKVSRDLSPTCGNQTWHLLDTLFSSEGSSEKMWAIQMLDSWGKPGAGLAEMELRWLGEYSECRNSSSLAVAKGNSSWYTSFTGKYCSIRYSLLPHAQEEIVIVPLEISLGVCVPSGCTKDDVLKIGQSVSDYISVEFSEELQVSCPNEDAALTTGAIVTIVFCSVFGAVCLVATVYDYIFQNYLSKPKGTSNSRTAIINVTSRGESNSDSGDDDDDDDAQLLVPNGVSTTLTRIPNTFEEFLMCFSLYTNGSKLLNTDMADDTLSCLHGIRFISLTWVILGHTVIFSFATMRNFVQVATTWMERFTFQAINNATVSVDTFFVLSGLLSSYLLLRSLQKTRKTFLGFLSSVPSLYLHRYIRLTPAYIFMVYIFTYISPYLYDGPLKSDKQIADPMCPKYAWKNFLYVQNIIDSSNQCAVWGWYLSNDFQFFLVMPFIVYLLYRMPKLGLVMKILMIIGSCIAATVVSTEYRLGLGIAQLSGANSSTNGTQGDYMTKYYYVPWVRYQSYGVGILFGYLIWKLRGRVRIHWLLNVIQWAVAATICLLMIYGPYDIARKVREATLVEAAIYNGWGRTAWSLGVGYVILACSLNHGGWIDEFLSWRGFIPLSRMTYSAYLLHPVVMAVFTYSSDSLTAWNSYTLAYSFCGYLVLSYGAAFVFSLVFEVPFIHLDKKYITGRLNRKGSS